MRIRASYIAAALLAALGGFVVFAVIQQPAEPLAAAASQPAPTGIGTLPGDGGKGRVPAIELETTAMKLGLVANDKIHEAKLKVRNRGTAPLEIMDIKTSCACTMGRYPRERGPIPPGGEGSIDVTLDPKRVPGFHSNKTLTVYSSDPKNPAIAVTVEADIDPEFEINQTLDFGTVNKGTPAEMSVTLRQIGPLAIEVAGVEEFVKKDEAPIGDVAYRFERVPEAQWRTPGKAEYTIAARLSEAMLPGAFTRYAVLSTNTPRLPKYRLNLKGAIKGFYTINPALPERLMLRKAEGGEALKGTAVVQADRPIAVPEVKADPATLKAAIRPGETPNAVYIDFETAPTAPPGRLDLEVPVTITSGPDTFTDRVGVRAYLTGGAASGPPGS